jgi:hypothetical protein
MRVRYVLCDMASYATGLLLDNATATNDVDCYMFAVIYTHRCAYNMPLVPREAPSFAYMYIHVLYILLHHA